MKEILYLAIMMSLFGNVYSQTSNYRLLEKSADSLSKKCQFKEALDAYQQILANSKGMNTHNNAKMAACCISLNYPNDSAFHYLIDYGKVSVWSFFLSEPAFEKIESDVRWNTFLQLIKDKYTLQSDTLGLGYRLLLTTILDQRGRSMLSNRCPYDKVDRKDLWKKIKRNDSINQIILQEIVSKYGWPTIKNVGYWPSSAAFMIVQHSAIEMQEMYLPVIDSLAKAGEIEMLDYVYLADRVMAKRQGVQLYGTQYNSNGIVPIFDPANINVRRIKLKIDPYSNEDLNLLGVDTNSVNK